VKATTIRDTVLPLAILFALALSCGKSTGNPRHDGAPDDFPQGASGGSWMVGSGGAPPGSGGIGGRGTGGSGTGGSQGGRSGGTGGVTGTGGALGSGGFCGRMCGGNERCCASPCRACVPQAIACTVVVCSPDGGGYDPYPSDCTYRLSGDSTFCFATPDRPHAYLCDTSILSDPCVSVRASDIGGIFCCP
jgi:hypothetical protein